MVKRIRVTFLILKSVNALKNVLVNCGMIMVISLVVMMQFLKKEFNFIPISVLALLIMVTMKTFWKKLASLKMTFQNYQMSKLLCVKVWPQYAVKSMSNGKSPGSDGYLIEFYKMFWNQIGPILVKSFNYSFNTALLSDSQRRGVISLIPKDGKGVDFLKN